MEPPVIIPIVDSSQIADARRQILRIARSLDFDENHLGKIAIIATEAATNVLKHGGGGEMMVKKIWSNAIAGIEIIALDRGPGIASISASMRDGHSTIGTAGSGLGSMARLSDLFDIYSRPGAGTALLCRLWSGPFPSDHHTGPFEIEGVSVAKAGEISCGDDWAAVQQPDRARLVVVDGLGHGPMASEASTTATQTFQRNPALTPPAMMTAIHESLRHSRGAAAAMAEIDLERRIVRYAGIGNISGIIFSTTGDRNMVSHNGTLGSVLRRSQEFSYEWPKHAMLVMYTDGIATHWSMNGYPGLLDRHPSLIAAIIYRDFTRNRDDATVVVVREREMPR